jgi:hypothetical protein
MCSAVSFPVRQATVSRPIVVGVVRRRLIVFLGKRSLAVGAQHTLSTHMPIEGLPIEGLPIEAMANRIFAGVMLQGRPPGMTASTCG